MVDRYLSVVSINRLANRIAPRLAVGTSLARGAFDGSLRELVPADDRALAAQIAHALRRSLDRCGEDDGFLSLIGGLSVLSGGFGRAWADTDAPLSTWVIEMPIDGIGSIALEPREVVAADGSGDALIVWDPAGEASAARLRRLAGAS